MAKQNKNQKMADEIIAALKDGTAPWIKPWTPDNSAVPHNPVTGTRYKGVNHIYLSMQGQPDPRWVTFNQAQKKGWQVKRGSKGTTVQFWQFEKEKKVRNENGEMVTERVKMERPLLRHYYVFNGSQIDGIPPLEPSKQADWERHDRAENLLKESGAEIQHVKGDRAAYSLTQDTIRIPERGQFDTPDTYYATALHELGHWTGHESRLDRKLGNVFGSEDYAREELRAEIASYMLGMELGIGHDPGQHMAYVDSWIKALEDHPTEIFRACADAEKIHGFILAFEQERDKNREAETMQEQPHYIIMEQSGVALSKTLEFLPLGDDKTAEYNTPADALRAAIDAKKELGEKLEGSELYVHRVNPPDDLEARQLLETGLAPILLKQQWTQNIGGDLPREFLPQTKNQSQPFLAFVGDLDTKADNQIEAQPQAGKRNSAGIIRLDNPLWIDQTDRTKDDITRALDKGHDGIVYTDKGKAVAVLAAKKEKIHKSMFQAARGLDKKYLAVPFADKNQAKELGSLWDKKAQSWYIPDGLDSAPFGRWQHSQARTADNPQQQFADFIRDMGGDLRGEIPIMDGKIHRIPEAGAKKGNKNIAYTGYLDGVPAGYVKNHHNNTEKKWKATGITLTDQDRARLKKEGAEKQAHREKERQKLHSKTAKESEAFTHDLPPATGKEKYFTDKNLNLSSTGAKTDKQGNIILPMKDVDGKQWSHLTLHPNGFKQILKDSRLQGTFALVGANNLNEIKGDLNLAEGYSTAATIHEATGEPVLITGTGNNLKHVARTLRDRYPEKNIFTLADDDQHLTDQGKMNTGRVQGQEAAKAVDGHVIFPDFAGAKPSKERTDFRDMAKMHGKEAVADYIAAQKDLALARAKQRKERDQDQTRQPEPALER